MSLNVLVRRGRVVPGVPSLPPNTYTAALKRFDDGSGEAEFCGVVSYAPGQVFSLADTDGMVIRKAATNAEPSSGIFRALLDGRHSDGSYKSVFVALLDTVNDANEVPYTVQVTGGARVIPDRDAPLDPVEFTNRAWQLAPTLFGITDPAYLCACEVAPLPLVPLSSMASSVQSFLTTELDAWLTASSTEDAMYNEAYIVGCRYLMTGNLDDLAEMCQRNASNGDSGEYPVAFPFSYFVAQANLASWATYGELNFNPANYGNTGNSYGWAGEPADNSLQMFLVYQLTGWVYGKLTIFKNAMAAGNGSVSVSDNTQLAGYSTGGSYTTYPRQWFRAGLQQAVLAHILRFTQTVWLSDTGFGGFTINDAGAFPTVGGRTMAQRVQAMIDAMETHANDITLPSWLPFHLWGFSQAVISTPSVPNFQWITAFATLLMAYKSGADTRSKVLTQLDQIAETVWGQQTGNSVSYNGYPIYGVPYALDDPAGLGASGSGVFNIDIAPLHAYAFARNNAQTTKRDRARYVWDARHIAYWNGSSHGVQLKSIKMVGELFHMTAHGEALIINGTI